jgi:hypothetical protein
MKNVKIIALCGPKGVGKSTVSKELGLRLGLNGEYVEFLSFAHHLKNLALKAGFEWEWITDPKLKEKPHPVLGISARQFMQGLSFLRDLKEDFFIKVLERQIADLTKLWKPCEDQPLYVIIDDCRFDNEAMWVNANGGKCFELYRDGVNYTLEHESETPVNRGLIHARIDVSNVEDAAAEIFSQR